MIALFIYLIFLLVNHSQKFHETMEAVLGRNFVRFKIKNVVFEYLNLQQIGYCFQC